MPKVKFVRQEFGVTSRSEEKREEAMKTMQSRDRLPSIRSRSVNGIHDERVVHVKLPRNPHTNFFKHQKMAVARLASGEFDESEPYRTPWEHNLAQANESRKHWVTHRDFKVVPCAANPPTEMLKNFVNLEPWGGEPDVVWGKLVKTHKVSRQRKRARDAPQCSFLLLSAAAPHSHCFITLPYQDYPQDEWVGKRGMRFNFSVKTPGV